MKTVGVVGIVLCVWSATAGAGFLEDFESYSLNAWPAPNWVGDGNAQTDPANNRVVLDPAGGSNQVLKLYGVPYGDWGALAYHPCTFTNGYFLEMSVYNGSESIMGGMHDVRGAIAMRYGTSWWGVTNPDRSLLCFKGDGSLFAGDNTVLATYQTGQWYDVGIHYTRNASDVSLQYWLDGVYLGAITSPIWDQSVESSFDHLDISAQGGTAYFDNIRLYSFGGPVTVPAPGAALLGLMGATMVGWLRSRKTL